MSCSTNIITANFSSGTETTTAPLYQWDYGQVLYVTGIDSLPETFQAHFAVTQSGGVATTVVGSEEAVNIPNTLLTLGKTVYCWIYVSDGSTDGETEYKITIPVKARPMPEYYDTEETGVFDGVVADVAGYAESAQASATAATASATAAATSETNAAASEQAAETAQTAAETAQAGAEASELAVKASENAAAASEQAAEDSATAAAENALAAEDARAAAQASATAAAASEATATEKAAQAVASATAAQASETAAAASETNAKTSEDNAAASESSAAASANSASASATSAAQSASEAAQSASVASSSATAAESAQTGAETARAASEAAQTAAETAETNAETAQAAAEAAQTAAEEAAASLTVDTALDEDSTNPVQNKVITEAIYDMLPEETATGNPVSINDGAKNIPVKALTVSFSPKQDLSNGAPSPTNICPISGWDALTVTGCGKNLLDVSSLTWTSGVLDDSGNQVSDANTHYSNHNIRVEPSATYVISGTVINKSYMQRVYFYDAYGNFISRTNAISVENKPTITIPSNCEWVAIQCHINETLSDWQIEEGSTATAYAPYTGDSRTISLPSTIYGGTVECVGGVGSSAYAAVDMGDLAWTYQTTNHCFEATVTDMKSYTVAEVPDLYCSMLTTKMAYVVYTSGDGIGVEGTKLRAMYPGAGSDATAFKAAVTGQTVVYPLATPTSFATTPVSMTTLKGNNTIWSDSNEDLSVTYRADVQQYISNAISAAVAE